MSWSSSRHGQGQISTMLMKKPMLRVQSERKLNFSDYQVRNLSREYKFLWRNILWCLVLFIKLKKVLFSIQSRRWNLELCHQIIKDKLVLICEERLSNRLKKVLTLFSITHTPHNRERKRNTLGCSGATSVKYSFNTTSRSRQVPADTSGYDTDNGTGTDADGTGPYCTTSEIRTNEGRTTYRTRTTLDSVRKDLKRFLWFLLAWNGQNWVWNIIASKKIN